MPKNNIDTSLTLSFSDNDLSTDTSLDQSTISFDVFGYLRNTFEEIDWNNSEIIFRSD